MSAPFIDRQAAADDLAACAEMLRGGSRSFYAASLLLPAKIRDSACALYAFCRVADDAIDLDRDPLGALEDLRERLRLIYAGQPLPFAVDRALAATVIRFDIPRALLDALLEGFEWDNAGRRYETLPDLYAYAARVAGTVGAMMAQIMGVTDSQTIARACELGVAMQLSNIARDVGEDARSGRIYLPLQWLREAGIDPDGWMRQPVFSDKLGSVVARLLAEANVLYDRSAVGIARLPVGCRPGIRTARFLYAEIGREVERAGLDSVSSRAVVSLGRKLGVLGRSFLTIDFHPRDHRLACLAEVRFLIDVIPASLPRELDLARPAPLQPSWWNLDDRVAWVVDLFDRLERREQLGRSRS